MLFLWEFLRNRTAEEIVSSARWTWTATNISVWLKSTKASAMYLDCLNSLTPNQSSCVLTKLLRTSSLQGTTPTVMTMSQRLSSDIFSSISDSTTSYGKPSNISNRMETGGSQRNSFWRDSSIWPNGASNSKIPRRLLLICWSRTTHRPI